MARPLEPVGPAIARLPDGTVKQVNPLTGTQVWTVPGRAGRPLPTSTGAHQRIDPARHGQHCAFCEGRYLDTPPEKARLVRDEGAWRVLTGLTAEELDDTTAEFRLVPNLFEIVSVDYWRHNHGYEPPEQTHRRRAAYLATPGGVAHVARLQAMRDRSDVGPATDGEAFFGGFHDVVIARRHFVDGARCEDELASAGTLTPEEHRHYVAFTVRALHEMFETGPLVANVAVFQNWLAAAGASFDHLHKQLVGIDTLGRRREQELARLEEDPDLFDRLAADIRDEGLVIAENEHAVAFAGVGHRYPSLDVWSRWTDAAPWELSEEQLGGWADLVHACHAATGPAVPTNEEWHYRPPGLTGAMPLRVVLKWRISTLAGFEGGTRIYINTIDPWSVRDRVRVALAGLAATGAVAPGIRIED